MSQDPQQENIKPKGFHTLFITRRPGAEPEPGKGVRPMTGAVTQVILDGLPLRGVSRLTFEVGAKEIAKVYLEMYADVQVMGEGVELHLVEASPGEYELGRMGPRPESIQQVAKAALVSEGAIDGSEKTKN